jgi:hypothetical protein
MASDTQKVFTVKFGKYARTIDYDDSIGHILFTFDGSERGPHTLTLEHHSPQNRAPNYGIAFERVKQHLESIGYEVEIYGE